MLVDSTKTRGIRLVYTEAPFDGWDASIELDDGEPLYPKILHIDEHGLLMAREESTQLVRSYRFVRRAEDEKDDHGQRTLEDVESTEEEVESGGGSIIDDSDLC